MGSKLLPIIMTADNLPYPFVASASSWYDGVGTNDGNPYKGFDGVNGGDYRWVTNNTNTGWLKIDLGVTYKINKYSIQDPGEAGYETRNVKSWTMEGSNNDSTWTTVDTQVNVAAWSLNEIREYVCNGDTGFYRYYYLNITLNQGGAYLGIGEWKLYISVAGGFSGFSPWMFMKDMWEKHNKLWTPKLKEGFSY